MQWATRIRQRTRRTHAKRISRPFLPILTDIELTRAEQDPAYQFSPNAIDEPMRRFIAVYRSLERGE